MRPVAAHSGSRRRQGKVRLAILAVLGMRETSPCARRPRLPPSAAAESPAPPPPPPPLPMARLVCPPGGPTMNLSSCVARAAQETQALVLARTSTVDASTPRCSVTTSGFVPVRSCSSNTNARAHAKVVSVSIRPIRASSHTSFLSLAIDSASAPTSNSLRPLSPVGCQPQNCLRVSSDTIRGKRPRLPLVHERVSPTLACIFDMSTGINASTDSRCAAISTVVTSAMPPAPPPPLAVLAAPPPTPPLAAPAPPAAAPAATAAELEATMVAPMVVATDTTMEAASETATVLLTVLAVISSSSSAAVRFAAAGGESGIVGCCGGESCAEGEDGAGNKAARATAAAREVAARKAAAMAEVATVAAATAAAREVAAREAAVAAVAAASRAVGRIAVGVPVHSQLPRPGLAGPRRRKVRSGRRNASTSMRCTTLHLRCTCSRSPASWAGSGWCGRSSRSLLRLPPSAQASRTVPMVECFGKAETAPRVAVATAAAAPAGAARVPAAAAMVLAAAARMA
eukprot:scaffold30075_cov61-Phaeocystis_antarctica.AAC.1